MQDVEVGLGVGVDPEGVGDGVGDVDGDLVGDGVAVAVSGGRVGVAAEGVEVEVAVADGTTPPGEGRVRAHPPRRTSATHTVVTRQAPLLMTPFSPAPFRCGTVRS